MIKIGSFYETNNYGRVQVISKSNRTDYYRVRFDRTGTEKEFRSSQIVAGCIRDPYAKKVCGVACTGDIKTKGKYKPYYSIWHDMINRCYNPNNKRYASYKSVTVSDEWLVFENFYNDVQNIEGFNDDDIRCGELVLDKDIKQRGQTNKVYSKNTCMWVKKAVNNQIQDAQQRPFYAISPDGIAYHESNITKFAREHGLNRKNISGVLHGRGLTVKQWQFSFEDIV